MTLTATQESPLNIDRLVLELRMMFGQAPVLPEEEDKATAIAILVSRQLNVPYDRMMSKCRDRELVIARQLAAYFIKKYTALSLKSIGSIFNRDHSTIIHAIQTIDDLLECNDRVIAGYYEVIDKAILR